MKEASLQASLLRELSPLPPDCYIYKYEKSAGSRAAAGKFPFLTRGRKLGRMDGRWGRGKMKGRGFPSGGMGRDCRCRKIAESNRYPIENRLHRKSCARAAGTLPHHKNRSRIADFRGISGFFSFPNSCCVRQNRLSGIFSGARKIPRLPVGSLVSVLIPRTVCVHLGNHPNPTGFSPAQAPQLPIVYITYTKAGPVPGKFSEEGGSEGGGLFQEVPSLRGLIFLLKLPQRLSTSAQISSISRSGSRHQSMLQMRLMCHPRDSRYFWRW